MPLARRMEPKRCFVLQLLQRRADGRLVELLRRLHADVLEHLVGVMAVMVVAAAALVVMVVVMVAAAALVTVLIILVVMVVVMVAAAALMLIILVVVIVVMVAAAALVLVILVVVIVVMVAAAALVTVLVMVVMMVMAAAALVVIVVVLVAGHQLVHGQQEVGRLDDVEDLLRRSSSSQGVVMMRARCVVLAQQLHRLVDAILRRGLGAAENDGLGGLNLVDEELAEVLGVHAALGHVGHGGAARQLQIVGSRRSPAPPCGCR